MKRKIAALMAVLLLLTSLSACKPEADPAPLPEPPHVTEPEEPAAPEELPQEPQPPVEQPPEAQVLVTDTITENIIEESVSYVVHTPSILKETGTAAQTINDYYQSVAGKIGDLAWGELYETALEQHATLDVVASFVVRCNGGDVLSIQRTTTVHNRTAGTQESTLAAETFNLQNGGLITMDDLFTVPENQYTARLTDAVRQAISQLPDPEDTYYEQWQNLVISNFDKTHFYVTQDAICIFYQEGDLGPNAQVEFSIPWADLEDIRG